MNFHSILQYALEHGASDIHLKVGVVPVVRKSGQLRPMAQGLPPISADMMEKFVHEALNPEEIHNLKTDKELDKGFEIKQVGRYRINVFRQRNSTRFVIRVISKHIPSLKELGLPSIVQKIAENERGLVLVTGATGSGKSTTLASMINHINHHSHKHIITLEDPIEYHISDRKSIISQRELGADMTNYSRSLRAALRQDPDVILVGEMRDQETIETALLAAETGHLVFSTLHTIDAAESVNRIIAQFSARQQAQIRRQLASVLVAVISQRLLARRDQKGLIPALEVMINNQRIKELILDPDRTHHINEAIFSSAKESGMRTFDQSLIRLVVDDVITVDDALKYTSNRQNFLLRVKGIQSGKESDWAEDMDALSRISKTAETTQHLTLDKTMTGHQPRKKKKR